MSYSGGDGAKESFRPRVLISAYACGPSDESEASAGWSFARAAAVEHDVWLITRRRFEAGITEALADDPDLAGHLNVRYTELSDRFLAAKRQPWDVYWYYALWQRKVAKVAADLHAEVGFDVAHHVTFASDWLPCGLRSIADVPVVWGPVGGATYLPWRLIRWLGWRNVPGELARSILTPLARRAWGDPMAKRAATVLAQNPEVANRFGYARRVVAEANAALSPREAGRPPIRKSAGMKRAIFVGRIVGWKGGRLAVAALAQPAAVDWTLEFFGAGRDMRPVQALAERLGVADRVTFHGHRPRAQILEAFDTADAMLFPSMHDSAGWVAAEASAAGCPVVCLDMGGPPFLAGPNAFAVSVDRNVVANLAQALDDAGKQRGEPYHRWAADRLPGLVTDWYADAISSVNGASSVDR